MSWMNWSADIKKKSCKYLLQRYVGHFLEELTLDQLNIDLYNGTCQVINLGLNVQALNEMGEQQHLPLEFVDGFITEISLSVPWLALLSQPSYIEVKGLKLTVQPQQRGETGASMFESMWNSMTSSVQLTQKCLEKNMTNVETVQPLEAVELFAQTIDSILSKIKVRFIDTVIRLEHVPMNSSTGVAMEIKIRNLEYSDEAGSDSNNTSLDSDGTAKGYIASAFSIKKFCMEGVTFYTDEFPFHARTFSRSMIASTCSTPDSKNSDSLFTSAQISPTQSMLHTPPEGNVNSSNESNPIMFAKLVGRQEVRLKMKQEESISGPKVELEITLGSLTMFLSPRQLHVLLELAHGLASPDLEDISNVVPKRYAEKPMTSSDFTRIEREFIYQTNPVQDLKTTDLRYVQGWSTASVDESDNEDEFLPMRLPGSTSMSDSIASNNFNMDDSISTSSVSSKNSITNQPRRSSRQRHNVDNDVSVETIQFHIRVASIALILLHEDILTPCVEQLGLTSSSVKQMKNAGKEFFKQLETFAMNGFGSKDFDVASKLFADVCRLSHIRLLAAPLIIEGSEKTTSQYSMISGCLTLASLEVVECLVDSNNPTSHGTPTIEFVELLAFTKESASNAGFSNKIDLRMNFKYTEKAVRHARMTKFTHPRTDIDIQMDSCRGEVDITIVDRISAILNPQPICTCNPVVNARDSNQQTLFDQAVDSATLPNSKVDVKISSSLCTIKLRFPIPDLRPLHDMNRAPWWKRSTRLDYMIMEMTDARVHFTVDSQASYLARYELQCRRLSLLYVETEGDTPIEIGLATIDEKSDPSCQHVNDGLEWARIVITVYPERLGAPLEDSSDEELENDKRILDDNLEKSPKHTPSPFTSRRIMRESDTLHSRSHGENGEKNEQSDGEELIIPGNRQEMMEFIEDSIHGSRLQLEINLPCASVQIPSKRIYEQLYNRFNTDLFLWEPSAPKPKYTGYMESYINLDLASTHLQESAYPRFSMCKSGIQYNSDSDSDEEDTNYSSANEKSHKDYLQTRTSRKAQSKLAITLSINQGLLTMYTPVRDSTRNVIPGQQGELMIRLKDATIFSVTAYKGNVNLSYACAMLRKVSLDHCGLRTSPSQTPPLKSINSVKPQHCKRTIYRTGAGSSVAVNSSAKDMMTMAMKVQTAHQTHRIKTFRVAMSISNGTLRHRMRPAASMWFTEMIDCLDVADHPVAGYTPPGVLTELHLHLWNCVIDYRPLHLPLRSIVTLGNFSMSSNITAQTNTSTLRFIAEDVALFISNKLHEKLVNLRQNYVCVMNFGLFELSLRLNEKMYGGAPRIDLRASNNVLHVRTCSDSARALMQLLTYIANDGDLQQLNSTASSTENISVVSSGSMKYEENLLGGIESINTLSRSQVERVYSLMEDALEETAKETTTQGKSEIEKMPMMENRVEFFFPDESYIASQATQQTQKNSKGSKDYSKTTALNEEEDDDDEEFCILGEEVGVGIMPRYGVPEVRSLCQEPLRIVDNHFSVPIGKTDLLQTPANYPAPILKYTLCEMTLIWHMYGGNDFDNAQPPYTKHVIINDNARNIPHGRSRSVIGAVGFNKSSRNEVHFGSVPNSPRARRNNESLIDWHILGGPNRQHGVLMELQLSKVRFQHEVYPENTREASRQVLLVHEIEVRDRLASSCINKFLYQYSSEARPKQSHSIMFTMKAVHVRPDPRLSAQECCLKLSLLPLRLNIDQDSLLFLIQFFNELGGGSKRNQESSSTPNSSQSTPVSKQGTPTHHPPIMSVSDNVSTNDDYAMMNMSQNNIIDQNLLILLEDELTFSEDKTKTKIIHQVHDDNQPIYFRSVVFGPEVFIRLDYHGKRVDFTHGPLAGLLMGLADLNCSELKLKRLSHRHGLLGYDKLFTYLASEWLQDIKKNQLPSLLGGVGPMYSVVQLFQGIRDLFWLPIEQYQKDGRIIRGLQRGANSFTTCTAMAALELTCRIVQALQTTAETAYDMVSPGPSVRCKNKKGHKGRRKRYNQPLDIREGVANAYTLVKEGLGETATQLVRVASEEHEHKGTVGAVGGVLRQIPPTVVKPIILATEATSNVLGGVRSSLVPDARREAVQKWRQDTDMD